MRRPNRTGQTKYNFIERHRVAPRELQSRSAQPNKIQKTASRFARFLNRRDVALRQNHRAGAARADRARSIYGAIAMNSINFPSLDQQLAKLNLAGNSFRRRVDALLAIDAPRLGRLWSYYRNTARAVNVDDSSTSTSPYRQAQEWGLPRRIKGDSSIADTPRREVVIENDIAWRVDAIVDFLFGKPVVIHSTAANESRRQTITQLLRAVIARNGSLAFFQQLALIGAVYGHVDVLVKLLPDDALPSVVETVEPQLEVEAIESAEPHSPPAPRVDDFTTPGANTPSPEAIERLARRVRFEIVEPARALPVLSSVDFSVVEAYAQVYRIGDPGDSFRETASDVRKASWFKKLFLGVTDRSEIDESVVVVDLITSDRWMTIRDDRVIAQGVNSLGRIPLVHIQNAAVPFSYAGASDVEPLLPLQDELNTRLSDRAHRIAMQSFKMFLGRGIDGFTEQTVAPGRMWTSDDPDAHISEFGGDAACPSEDAHIRDLREALDKTSGVSPIAAGAIKGRIGRLTSAAALRVTMLSLLARTERKRATYGAGIAQLCELALAWLDRAGAFANSPAERSISIEWPNPIPLNEIERLDEAQRKLAVGVPREVVLRELGYDIEVSSTETNQNEKGGQHA
jgi:hypothetical protein